MSRQFTEADVQEIAKAEDGLRSTGFDVDHEGADHNGQLVLQYFQANPSITVTVANIYSYIEKNKSQFIWRTQAQMEYDRFQRENPSAATAVANWLATQGKPGQLVNTGDEAFHNAAALIVELRGRDVNPVTIGQALGRLTCRVGSNLHFVPQHQRQEIPADYRPGQFITDANISPVEYARRARAANEQKQESSAPKLSADQQRWKEMAEEKLGSYRSHSQKAAYEKAYNDALATTNSYRDAFEAVLRVWKAYNPI
jgi:hypothetical protein